MMQSIEGLLVDRSGRPVADATLSIVQATAPVADIAMMTDGSGRFYLDDLPSGRFRLQVMPPDGSGQTTVDFAVPRANGLLRIQLDR
ncbi:carboxypeptidase-like regulatory domain-containing protein [Neolewinella xylanilytica]|uniref:carboxypeptidase-like regulatory domain-containing protein n=1 Tax=Neolewinella xylanilytica TaxID=1514080 RepID=UPI000CEB077C|nr:carboxypeptidase-like regulatory domain-containing protein [Neolewinella xylanilytica]